MRLAVFCDVFPELSETFVVEEVRALRRRGHEVAVVAAEHARRPADVADLDVPVTWLEDLRRPAKAAALARLALRRPARTARAARDRRAWRPAEDPRRAAALAPVADALARRGVEHVHAHFAAGAAVEALRVGALLGVPVSVTAHAHEIFATPRNLAEKLRRAAFTTTGCAYNARHLRGLVAPEHAARIHEVVVGVDLGRWTRRAPPAAGRHVVAVGRLVEKKGFADLLEAAALLHRDGRIDRLTIAGAGPLEDALRARVRDLGLQDVAELPGPRTPDEVRALLEDAAVLAMPCVVAADGDRDSMPVVVKEAMAMEVPVVVTDEVGLPELVDEGCGRLVPPRDPAALAAALGELLDRPPDRRAELGRAGRARVRERADQEAAVDRLLDLVATAGG